MVFNVGNPTLIRRDSGVGGAEAKIGYDRLKLQDSRQGVIARHPEHVCAHGDRSILGKGRRSHRD